VLDWTRRPFVSEREFRIRLVDLTLQRVQG
jgi:hypothetical protein